MKKPSQKNDYNAINIYYKNYLAEIGGIETATYNIALKYSKKKDILFLIGNGHANQLSRLSKIARVEIYDPKKTYTCKKCFITYETEVPKNIKAEKYARVSHGDLEHADLLGHKWPTDDKVTEDYGVSKNTCKTVKKVLGKDAKYCPNPYVKPVIKPLLKLISPQRMTAEKGADRIKAIAEELDKHDIPYQWIIMCNDRKSVDKLGNPNLIWAKSRLDIYPYLNDCDYLVLVSDTEGSPMSPQEALMIGKPIIVTDLPCYKDLNINKNHGFFLDLELSNLDVEEIYKKKGTFNFEWQPPKDIWGEILEDGQTANEIKPIELVKVQATSEFVNYEIRPAELDHIPFEGEIFELSKERAEYFEKNVNHENKQFVIILNKGEKICQEKNQKLK